MDLEDLYYFYISLKKIFNPIKTFNQEPLTKDNNSNKDKTLTILKIFKVFNLLVSNLVVLKEGASPWVILHLNVLNKYLITFLKICTFIILGVDLGDHFSMNKMIFSMIHFLIKETEVLWIKILYLMRIFSNQCLFKTEWEISIKTFNHLKVDIQKVFQLQQ